MYLIFKNKNTLKEIVFFSLTVSVVIISFLSFLNIASIRQKMNYEKNLGERAVYLMYQFDSIFDLTKQMEELKTITTEDVFRSLDINYDSRIISIYFKFKAEPTQVEIISSIPGSICYRLLNPNISSDRVFLFRYTLSNGIINSFKEIELVPSIDNYGGVMYQ